MDQLIINSIWMTFNVILAIIPVIAARLFIENKKPLLKILALFIWFFFLPNAIYLVTDIVNLFHDIKYINGILLTIDIAVYLILIPIGVITHVAALYPVEKLLTKNKSVDKNLAIYFLNLMIGFGVILGRVQRVNSWEIVTDIPKVVSNILVMLRSSDLMIYVIIFAIFSQIVYTVFKAPIVKRFNLK